MFVTLRYNIFEAVFLIIECEHLFALFQLVLSLHHNSMIVFEDQSK